ncbi:transcription factor FapR [Caldalkalibacillus salinus]|uniref:transcription factor FapR n=1 Tax=Caldalkalibacillus salinus TaxID=2803787 RepID=UPI00192278CB|nr:transcription factor FapR [Caldalkalibacillus salinus]
MAKLSKSDRQNQLVETLKQNPFMTDEELAHQFNVSVQTIRLDRLEKSIPELRERIKYVAEQNYDEVKSLMADEVIGEIIDLQLDDSAISILDIRDEHVFTRNKIARGHHLFAQANSLAVAVINDELALTSSAEIKFLRSVRVGERVVAKAQVMERSDDRTKVKIDSFIGNELVFSGRFNIYRKDSQTT